ncbi:DUF6916 family protein [Sphingomonas sp. MMS24-J45]|uniref:DUF6916 family protein n=1 Tax=Sphingomonas sp. MMS24-J45 TaxID=3238806 RepID=UPI00384F9A3A
MTEGHSVETFLPLVGTDFTVRGDGLEDVLRLEFADALTRVPPEGFRKPFSLTFLGTRTDYMVANLIEMTHPAMEPFYISLSPIARTPEGAFRYEALYN